MSLGILGKKVGMTRVYDEDGAMVPVTVIDVSGNTLLQKRTKETDCLLYTSPSPRDS